MSASKAQVIAVTPRGVTVSVLIGEWRDKCYAGLPLRDDVEKGQFVDVLVHPSGQHAEWPRTG